DTAESATLSLHDALPISRLTRGAGEDRAFAVRVGEAEQRFARVQRATRGLRVERRRLVGLRRDLAFGVHRLVHPIVPDQRRAGQDRKSTRLNSSHVKISY